MKYIIMCGGTYSGWEDTKHTQIVKNESIVGRTIRLLRECGVDDIAISTDKDGFDVYGVPVLVHDNPYGRGGLWIEGFYPTNEPTCYIFGDVVFSEDAIKTIVNTPADVIEFFASAPPFARDYIKPWAEPFALKVNDQEFLRMSVSKCREIAKRGEFRRKPIMWELWQVIKGTPINVIDYTNYHVINDWTCDADSEEDLKRIMEVMT